MRWRLKATGSDRSISYDVVDFLSSKLKRPTSVTAVVTGFHHG